MKLKYIHAIKGSALALVIFTIAAIFIPGHGPSQDVELTLTVSSFLFAILSGFFISRLNARYNEMRNLVSQEDAYFSNLYQMGRYFASNFQKRLGEIIDQYYIKAFDDELGVYKANKEEFLKLYDELDRVDITKNSKGEQLFDDSIMILNQLEAVRNKSSVVSREKMRAGQWIIMLSLTSIIIFSLYYLKVPKTFSQVTSVLLSTIMILVLLLIRDLKNFRLGGEGLLVESGQEVLEDLGKLRYYNHKFIEDGSCKIPKNIKKYRVGYHDVGEPLDIKIVKKG